METNQRYCLTLDLKEDPDLVEQYKYWHKPGHIWHEIPEGISSVGIINMQIYLLGTRLFMIIETHPGFNFEQDMEKLSTLLLQKEWESFVSRFQKTSPDASSSEKWKLMEKIFDLDECF